MYNSQKNSSQYTMQSSSSNSNTNGFTSGDLAVSGILLVVPLIFSIILFILWLWSIVSVISLNKKFNEFLDLYKEVEFEEVSTGRSVNDKDYEMSETEKEAARLADIKKQRRLQISVAVVAVLIVVLLLTVLALG